MKPSPRQPFIEALESSITWAVRSRAWAPIRALISILLWARERVRGTKAPTVPSVPEDLGVEVLINTLGSSVGGSYGNIRDTEKRLWGGYSAQALADFEAILHSRRIASPERAKVAWVLARWHSAHGDFEKALLYAVLMRALHPAEGWWRECGVSQAMVMSS